MKRIMTDEFFGVARVIGLGNKIDLEESEALEYLGQDSETKAIIMYLESIKHPRRLLDVAKNVTPQKPVVMLKSGSTEAGKKAAAAHTAALAAEDRLVDGLLRQAGIVRLRNYIDLILAGKGFAMLELPKGNRVGILAPSGAMCVVLSDLCVRLGLEVPEISAATTQKLEEMSAAFVRMRNPVDVWAITAANGFEGGYAKALRALFQDPNVDAVVAILMSPIALMGESLEYSPSFDFIVQLKEEFPEKPLLLSYSGDRKGLEQLKIKVEPNGIPTFIEIEQPFETLSILARSSQARARMS
jgi:acetyltransferase